MKFSDLDTFAPWLIKLKYDEIEKKWIASFFPDKIVIFSHFTDIAIHLAQHGMDETINLVAEALQVQPDDIRNGYRGTKVVHARFVAIYILRRRFNVSLQAVAKAVGYKVHMPVLNAIKRVNTVPEIKKKLQRVYGMYPWMYCRKNTIK